MITTSPAFSYQEYLPVMLELGGPELSDEEASNPHLAAYVVRDWLESHLLHSTSSVRAYDDGRVRIDLPYTYGADLYDPEVVRQILRRQFPTSEQPDERAFTTRDVAFTSCPISFQRLVGGEVRMIMNRFRFMGDQDPINRCSVMDKRGRAQPLVDQLRLRRNKPGTQFLFDDQLAKAYPRSTQSRTTSCSGWKISGYCSDVSCWD